MPKQTTTICCDQFVDILLWDKYGYWADGSGMPDWYDQEAVDQAKECAMAARPTVMKLTITGVRQEGANETNILTSYGDWLTDFAISDDANSWADPFTSTVRTKTREPGENYDQSRLVDCAPCHS